ncbi:MAG: sterol desaturase family protein [Hyphomonadaceae bacterium]|nr:sterol desaturase family protein [Hyphomonadaceae bacterium]
MATTDTQNSGNRRMPEQARIARFLETWLGAPLHALEFVLQWILVKPTRWFWRHLDSWSYKLEGTLLRKILSSTLFPFTLVLSVFVGLKLVENGITSLTLVGFVLLPIIYGLYCAPFERLMPYSRKWLEGGNDTAVDIIMYFSGAFWSGISGLIVSALFIIGMVEALEPYGHNLWPDHWNPVIQVALFILIKDFFRYWFHRALHEIPALWRIHAAHHSVERLYWLNGIRAHPLEILSQAIFYAIPLALVQPSAEIALVAVILQLSIGIFQHSNIDLNLGWWEYIFSIGDNHRYHHYPDKGIGDSNYGGELIIYDILFGTFHNPRDERPHDNIGIGTAPDYPMTVAGLYIAPFLPNQKDVFRVEDNSDEEDTAAPGASTLQPAE